MGYDGTAVIMEIQFEFTHMHVQLHIDVNDFRLVIGSGLCDLNLLDLKLALTVCM